MRILTHLPERVGLTLAVLTLAAASALSAPVITNVVETGGMAPDIQGNGYADTWYPQWTGLTHTNHQANEPVPGLALGAPYVVPPFGNWAPSYLDRGNRYTNTSATVSIPAYLVGGDYIMTGNDNRARDPYQLDVSVSQPALVFMLVDNRLSDGDNTNPANYGEGVDPAGWTTMTWLGTDGFKPVLNGINRASDLTWPDEVGLDESSDGTINNWFCVYWREVPAGTFSLYQPYNSGRSMYGAVVTAVTPPAPANLQAASMQARVILNWSAAAGATNYVVRRSDSNGGPYTDIGTTPTTSFTDSTVVNDRTYYYVVAAVGLLNTSVNSAQVTGVPRQAKPEGLVATGGNGQISLSWNALSGAASYTVKRADGSGGPFATIASGITAPSYVDTGLPGGRSYYYTVFAALTAGGESASSDETSALTAPELPAGFVAEQFAATVIRLKWNSADVVPPTTLVEKSPDGTAFTQVGAITNGGKIYFDVGLSANVTNYYRVRATNTTGISAYTAVSSASTPAGGLNVNFANFDFTNATGLYPIPGYLDDFGLVYGDQGNGYSYGWETDNTGSARWSGSVFSPDERYDTMTHLQKPDPSGHTWEIGVANGLYLVHIVSGQATAFDSVYQWDLEGWISAPKTPSDANRWQDFFLTTKVEDGRMTFNNGPSASNNKIAFVGIYPTTPQPNVIATQPISQTVPQNQPVSFSVVVGGGPEPYRYQWYGPAGLISGAEGATYTIPLSQVSDAGTYYVIVANAGASIQSSNVTLSVVADVWSPTALSAGSVDGTSIGIAFSEDLDPASATTSGNYLINGQASVSSVVQRDNRTVQVYLSTPVTANFQVTIAKVEDLAHNPISATNLNGVLMGLTPTDLSSPGLPGESFTADGSNLLIVGGGADFWGTFDQGHYACKMVAGDFDARVRVAFLTQANEWSKAGLMVREATNGDDRNVMLCTTPLPLNNLYQTQWRETPGGDSGSSPQISPVSYPNAWIRLVRQGNVFTTMIKTNDTDWIRTYNYMPGTTYPNEVLLGLAVTAHNNGNTATGMFSGFSVSAPMTDLAVSQTVSPSVVGLGGTIIYTVTVKNQGLSDPAAVVTNLLPTGVSYVGSIASVGSAVHANGTVTWTVGALASGASATLTITAQANTSGTKVNTATATSGLADENVANNSASTTVTVPTPPAMTGPAYANGQFSFSLATEPGLSYRVEYTDDLAAVNWTTLTTLTGDGSVHVVADSTAVPSHRFYRTVIVTKL